MGAINSAFNQAVGSVAAAATLVKGSKEHDMEQALLGKEQAHEASADLIKLAGESEAAEEALKKANEAVEATKGWNMEGKNSKMLKGKVAKRLSEKEAAQRAFDELQDRIEAKKAMKSRAELMMNRANK